MAMRSFLRWLPFFIIVAFLFLTRILIWHSFLYCWFRMGPGCELEFIWSNAQGFRVLLFVWWWHLGAVKSLGTEYHVSGRRVYEHLFSSIILGIQY
ncbi:hypothetical protein F4814DRAFT_414768 [Daldinia grandis]|nr:hypothetical protein F4814DRAFT_414768 [Daldinia grandis]